LASRLVELEIDVFRELGDFDDEDVDLSEFSDEIESWVIKELKRIGLDTAKSVLTLSTEDLVRRTDLEDETIQDVMKILKQEFE
jgi:N utilization substance protein A